MARSYPTWSPREDWFTTGLIVCFAGIWLAMGVVAMVGGVGFGAAFFAPPVEVIDAAGALDHESVEAWRLVAANFLHYGMAHLWFNVSALAVVGPIIERWLGGPIVLALFVVTGVLGLLGTVPFYEEGRVVGASAGIMGLIGFLAMTAWLDREGPLLWAMLKWIIAVLVIGVVATAWLGVQIDNLAHAAGTLAGALAAGSLSIVRRRWLEAAWMWLLLGSAAALVVWGVVGLAGG